MTDNRATELPRMQLHRLFEKHGVDYWCAQQTTFWNSESGSEFLAYQYQVDGVYKLAFKGVNVTPEQAIAATLGNERIEKLEELIRLMWLYLSDPMTEFPCCIPVCEMLRERMRALGLVVDDD